MADVYLGLGSNIRDRSKNIRKAIALLRKLCTVEKVSSFYETEPVGFRRQRWFVNCVVKVNTSLSITDFFKKIMEIEKTLGKKVVRKNGPRTIDIDVLLHGNKRIRTKTMTIPHPRFHRRAFVLVPFAEIAPKARHPVLRKTVAALLKDLKTTKEVRKAV